ncbi:6259_t:CDS:2 [Cetraspora pellucida]|uniref:6259_t:CDS:1 n=1 Tax=Cetraspora pellucida TaxID=1433469 RepID=A0ACA9KGN1_9GLOM|nr:6259_t:CDS:2 [Cetraspora pellucida]
MMQTLEHFGIECRISQVIWRTAYSFFNIPNLETPKTLDVVVTADIVGDPKIQLNEQI